MTSRAVAEEGAFTFTSPEAPRVVIYTLELTGAWPNFLFSVTCSLESHQSTRLPQLQSSLKLPTTNFSWSVILEDPPPLCSCSDPHALLRDGASHPKGPWAQFSTIQVVHDLIGGKYYTLFSLMSEKLH